MLELAKQLLSELAFAKAAAEALCEHIGWSPVGTLKDAQRMLQCVLKWVNTLMAVPAMSAADFAKLDGDIKERLLAWMTLFQRHAKEKSQWAGVFKESVEEMDWQEWLKRRGKGGGLFRFFSWHWRKDTRLFRRQLMGRRMPIKEEQIRLIRAVATSAGIRRGICEFGEQQAGMLGEAWKAWDSDLNEIKQAVDAVVSLWDLIARKEMPREVVGRIVTGDRSELRDKIAALTETMKRFQKTWHDFLGTCNAADNDWFPGGVASQTYDAIENSITYAADRIEQLEQWADLNVAEKQVRSGPGASFVDWAIRATTVRERPCNISGSFLRQFYRTWLDAGAQ
ncbi:MAG: hypothetical protein FWD53_11975 [Phycisphaerales bacterium]|nr:hypothetical protein [Phycisphaerales bacterium]